MTDTIVTQIPELTLAGLHATLACSHEGFEAIRKETRTELISADGVEANNQSIVNRSIRFHIDDHIGRAANEGLHRRGIFVSTVFRR